MPVIGHYRSFEILEHEKPGEWLENSIGTDGLSPMLPAVFDRYVRVLHPAYHSNMHGPDFSIPWSKLAHYYGRTFRNQVTVDALLGRELDDPIEDNPVWDTPPETGSLPVEEAWQLIDTLAAETAKPLECFFGVWEGFACLDDLRERTSARIHLPGRNHIALRGPVYLAPRSLCTMMRQSVNLWWNVERSWCVATDIDLDSTFVGGSRDCIQKLLDNSALETTEVTPDTPLGG